MDSPMETLPINHLTYALLTALNNVWAWIAFVASAISFWRIHFSPPLRSLPPSQSPVAAEPCNKEQEQELPSTTTPTPPSLTPSKRYASFCTLENRTSGKFSIYLGQDEKTKYDNIDTGSRERIPMHRKEEEWEAVLKMKTADMVWYRYQDLTVLNGNVVRLWDENRHVRI